MRRLALVAVGLAVLTGASATRQAPDAPAPPGAAAQEPNPAPWAVGERLEYGLKFGLFNVGRGSMEVLGIDTIRGEPCYHVLFVIRGKALTYSLHDSLQSWFGVNDLVSRRFSQGTEENGRQRFREYEIYPDRRAWVRNNGDTGTTVAEPLDDASFIYFARTQPLEVGRTYRYNRYFQHDRNPVTIQVLQRQTISVPAGRFAAIAVRPVFRSRGLFAQGGQAVIWFSDDSVRVPLKIRTSLPLGTLEMSLRSRS